MGKHRTTKRRIERLIKFSEIWTDQRLLLVVRQLRTTKEVRPNNYNVLSTPVSLHVNMRDEQKATKRDSQKLQTFGAFANSEKSIFHYDSFWTFN